MYLAIGKFSPRHGIPLSKATIFGGAVTNNYFNVQKRHPACNRPMIDYDICMVQHLHTNTHTQTHTYSFTFTQRIHMKSYVCTFLCIYLHVCMYTCVYTYIHS